MPERANMNRCEEEVFEESHQEVGHVLPYEGEASAMGKRRRRAVRLDSLLTDVTDSNRHDEVDAGPRRGREVW